MNGTEERIEQLKSITIDPDFEKVCPPLTEDEFSQLEQNILSDGAVTSPLVVWNNILIDGHHRRQIILKHPELEYHIQEVTLPTRAEAIAWICKNQVGRRNLTPKQLVYLIGMRYALEKQTWGASDGFRGNGRTGAVSCQSENLQEKRKTCEKVAKEFGISSASVNRALKFTKGIEAAEAACPGVKWELLHGGYLPPREEIARWPKLPKEELAAKVAEIFRIREEIQEKARREKESDPIETKQERAIKFTRGIDAAEAACPGAHQKLFEGGYLPPHSVIGEWADLPKEEVTARVEEVFATQKELKRKGKRSLALEIIREKGEKFQKACEAYCTDFPELLEEEKQQLLQSLEVVTEYLLGLRE